MRRIIPVVDNEPRSGERRGPYGFRPRTNVFRTPRRLVAMAPETELLRDAIERVYVERYEAYCRMARLLTRDMDLARDSVQEGFARALAHLGGYRGEGTLDGWIWRIIYRVAIDMQSGKHPALPPEAIDVGHAQIAWSVELPYPERDPVLTAALRGLPPRQRLLLFLRYFADLSHADIASVTGVRLGTVSATLNQARAALTAQLGDDYRPFVSKGVSSYD